MIGRIGDMLFPICSQTENVYDSTVSLVNLWGQVRTPRELSLVSRRTLPCVDSKTPPCLCAFKTSPCVLAPRAHVKASRERERDDSIVDKRSGMSGEGVDNGEHEKWTDRDRQWEWEEDRERERQIVRSATEGCQNYCGEDVDEPYAFRSKQGARSRKHGERQCRFQCEG